MDPRSEKAARALNLATVLLYAMALVAGGTLLRHSASMTTATADDGRSPVRISTVLPR